MNSELPKNNKPPTALCDKAITAQWSGMFSHQSVLFWSSAFVAVSTSLLLRWSFKFVGFILICTLVCALCDRFKPPILYKSGQSIIWLLTLVAGCLSAFLLFTSSNIGDVDFACYSNVFWNTLHGNFLYHSFLEQNVLAIHLMPMALVFVPFYALMGNYGLIIAQTLAWGSGLWILFSLENNAQRAPVLLILAVALVGPLIAPLFFGFHPDILFMPIAAWAIMAYHRKNVVQFSIAIVLLPLIKEVFIVTTFGFAMLAFWDKRTWYWRALPVVSSLVLVLFFWFVLSPFLRSGSSHAFSNMVPTSLPMILNQVASVDIMRFVFVSIIIVLPALVSHSLKFALLPIPLIVFYAIFPDESFRDFWRHYGMAAAWVALFSLTRCSAITLRRMAAPFLLISCCFCFIWISLLTVPRTSLGMNKAIGSALSQVTPHAKLVAHGSFMAFASQRRYIMNWIYSSDSWVEYDYLLFDRSFKPAWWIKRDSLDEHINRLLTSPSWKLMLKYDNLYLFKRIP